MSEPQLISPMLDNFIMGDPISNHDGVRSCPAVEQKTQDKYIVKIISTPASASQLDALLLSGAYADKSEALAYFEELTKGIEDEIAVLDKLSTLEGFIGFDMHQTVLDQHAVFSAQGNDIAHGADRGKIGVILEQSVYIRIVALDRLYQLKSDPDAR